MKHPRQIITATFESRRPEDVQGVKAWLKRALRQHGLRCVSITAQDTPAQVEADQPQEGQR